MTRRRGLLLVGLVVFVAVIVGGVVGRQITSGFDGRYAIPPAGAPLPTGAVGPLPPPVGRAASVVAPPPAGATEAAPAVDAPDPDDADRIAGAISRAKRKALRRGEPVRWHKAGEEGYVTVSEASDDGRRLCRNVAASIRTPDGETRSTSHLWCSDDGDEWEPAS